MIREPVVAGSFYPGTQIKLKAALDNFIKKDQKKYDAYGVVSPHAGYIYSGAVAGEVFSCVNLPEDIVILAPNHTGLGESFAMWPEGKWQTPLGAVDINQELNNLIKKYASMVTEDTKAHLQEHSAEVQVPFLQYLKDNIKIVAIVMASTSLDELKVFGTGVGKAIKDFGKPVLIVASSDMTHYESHQAAKDKDQKAIDKMVALDEDGLYQVVNKYQISMCGYAPTISMLTAAKQLGAQAGHLIRYMTSGETSGDYNQVVGYAGLVVS